MTSLVRRFLKTGIVFLAIGLAIGAWMIVQRELGGGLPSPWVTSAHTHAILVGFVMMMILGVALWMFPRPAKGDTRYDPRLAEGAYWMLTVATASRVLGELVRATTDAPWLRWSVVVAGLLQVAGLLMFFATMWSRIRGVGSAAREAAGERF
ncbi:MAG: cbb3-type cytochrome c oxidase subunit I [Gemmatimonadaceae bacterium]